MGNGELNHVPNRTYAACPYFDQKSKKSTPRRETAGVRRTPIPTGPGESSKVRRLQEKARREVDLSSSYLEDNSKPGPNRSLRPLSCNLWKTFYVQGLRMGAGIAGAHASGRAGQHFDEEKGKKLVAVRFDIIELKTNAKSLVRI